MIAIDAPDPRKDALNKERHEGRSLWLLQEIEIATAFSVSARTEHDEVRLQVIGRIRHEVCSVIVTIRDGRMRPISLRAASPKERKLYAEKNA